MPKPVKDYERPSCKVERQLYLPRHGYFLSKRQERGTSSLPKARMKMDDSDSGYEADDEAALEPRTIRLIVHM